MPEAFSEVFVEGFGGGVESEEGKGLFLHVGGEVDEAAFALALGHDGQNISGEGGHREAVDVEDVDDLRVGEAVEYFGVRGSDVVDQECDIQLLELFHQAAILQAVCRVSEVENDAF